MNPERPQASGSRLRRRRRAGVAAWLVGAVIVGGAAVWWAGRREVSPSDAAFAAGVVTPPAPAMGRAGSRLADGTAARGATAGAGVVAPALWTSGVPVDAARIAAALPAPADRVDYVRIDRSVGVGKHSPFWQPGGRGRIALPLPDGDVVAVIERSTMLGADRWVSEGAVEGRPGSRLLLAWSEGQVHAEIFDPETGTWVVRTATADWAQVYRVAPEKIAPCGGARVPARGAAATDTAPAGLTSAPGGEGRATSWSADDGAAGIEVHVLMAHTTAVLATLTGPERTAALQSAFDLAIAKANRALADSLVAVRLKLVGVAEVNHPGDENAGAVARWQDDSLTALYRTADGTMDEVHARRDEVGADFVCLALNRPDFGSSGLSFVLSEPGDPDNARYAFAVVNYAQMTGSHVVTHELGHLFGCEHDRPNADSVPAFSYGYGHRFLGGDGRWYHDIMSYPRVRNSSAPVASEVGYFSTTRVTVPSPVAAAPGVAIGTPGEADTARTIERTAPGSALYRTSATATAPAAVLVNAATRAWVGTEDQALFGGFVVAGGAPTPVLVRAAGPALGGLGVPGALADPRLRIYGGAVQLAENDNWEAGDGGAAVRAAGARAGAFPFSPGSADAAVLLTLPPGAYSAIMDGARGANGIGLIEAYDAGSGAARLINLAARAYADRSGREIHAGFVVRAGPGETRRMLLRVLGPSLARAPFNLAGVLDDPEMALKNAAGDTLLVNDDWSSGAAGGAGPANDFAPLIVLHGEKQIAATGHAPGNRREPCVLIDLPAGAYTVVVRPFERRSPDPELDQPAVPGLGIVEVYEIRP